MGAWTWAWTLLLVSCTRLPPTFVWVDEPACAMPQAALEACTAAGGSPGRSPECGGTQRPDPTPAEARAAERDYRTGRATCRCLTPAFLEGCRNTP